MQNVILLLSINRKHVHSKSDTELCLMNIILKPPRSRCNYFW